MLNEAGINAFELAVREILEERRVALSMTEYSLGRLAFPHVIDFRRKVQAIRIAQGKGKDKKPQRLRTVDVMNLCEALGLRWQDVLREANSRALEAQEAERLNLLRGMAARQDPQ